MLRAAWVLPVAAPPIPDGVVLIRDGLLVEVRPWTEADRDTARELGDCILMPGLIDAHCHTEWSILEGLLPSAPFGPWLQTLVGRTAGRDPGLRRAGAAHGAARSLLAGTTTLADSGPGGFGVDAIAATGQRGIVYLEAFGRQAGGTAAAIADRLADTLGAMDARASARTRIGVAPHAPYTVGPSLWAALDRQPTITNRPWTTHLAESPGEAPAIAERSGPLADALAAISGGAPAWWPGAGGPVTRLAARGALRGGLVAAHCVQVDGNDIQRLAASGVAVAHCPRSNAHLECGTAPVAALRAAGVRVAIGTDSPASGGDYDVRAEARAAREQARVTGLPAPSPSELVEMCTRAGAAALGLAGLVGELRPGLAADLLILRAPERGWGSDDPCERALDPGATVDLVMVAGESLVEGGIATGIDAEEARTAAAEAARALC